jgi:predicted transcriptional regulator
MIEKKERYSIDELFSRLPISISELARRSKISEVTAASIRDGRQARLHTINRLLSALSELYRIDLSIKNVDGLYIMHGRYGDRSGIGQ